MPRKTTTIVTCSLDTCKNFAEVTDIAESPQGWYMVLPSTHDPKHGFSYSRNGAFEFCSLRCMEKWSGERRRFLSGRENGQLRQDGVINRVREAISIMEESFTRREIGELIPEIELDKISSSLKTLVDSGEIILVKQGAMTSKGRQPNIYKVA